MAHVSIHTLIHPLICSPTHLFTHSLIHAYAHPPSTQPLIHSCAASANLNHSPRSAEGSLVICSDRRFHCFHGEYPSHKLLVQDQLLQTLPVLQNHCILLRRGDPILSMAGLNLRGSGSQHRSYSSCWGRLTLASLFFSVHVLSNCELGKDLNYSLHSS